MRFMQAVNFFKHHKRRLLLLLIPVIIFGFIFWPKPQTPIETYTVKQTDIIESISATGSVDATSVDLNFLSGGKLAYLGVKKGDNVKVGQTIATLDQRTVQKNLETSLRTYSQARNNFEGVKETNNPNNLVVANLNSSLKRILENNQYDLEKAVISVELQDLAKQQAVLTSPIAGVVTRADAKAAGVNVGLTTTFTIADLKVVTFKIDIDEADIGRVAIGQKVTIVLDAFPDQTLTAKVESIDFAAHTTTTGGNVYTVSVTLPDSQNFVYRIGMNGDAEIITNEKESVLSIPISSVADDEYVYVKTNGNFEKKKIKIGLQNDTDAEIISGLTSGDQVALDPIEAEKVAKK